MSPPLSIRALPASLLEQLAALTPPQLATLTETERAEIAESLDAHERFEDLATFRRFAESPHYCHLTLSPLMAAIMDASEGIPVTTIDDEASRRHFGCPLADLPRVARRLVAVRAGGRAGKSSRLLAAKALHAALTVPLTTLAHGERAVALLMAPDMSLARQVLGFVRGYCEASPALSSMVLRDTADEIELQRPDGLPVLIRVRAASRGGRGGRGFVLVFAGLDEAAFFRDESSGVVNDTEVFRAVEQRLTPGAQCWIASTPWVAGVGILEETLAKDLGAHVHALCAVAPTRALNPTWDPDGTIEAAMRERDPENADREIGAIPLAAGSLLFFDKVSLDAATDTQRPQDLPPESTALYASAGDFAFRRNASAIAVVRRHPDESGDEGRDWYELVFLDERKPEKGQPLKPAAVVDDFAPALNRYGVGHAGCDSHERDQVADELARYDVTAVPLPAGQTGKAEQHLWFRRLTREGRWRMPRHPRLRAQLGAITSRPAPGGGLSISSPTTADGSHGDIASAVIGAAWMAQFIGRETHPAPPAPPPYDDSRELGAFASR